MKEIYFSATPILFLIHNLANMTKTDVKPGVTQQKGEIQKKKGWESESKQSWRGETC